MIPKKLLIVLICSVVLAYIYASNKNLETLCYVLKPLATLLVISIPLLHGKTNKTYKFYILIGLVFCLIGDVLLLFKSLFIFGLIAFLIGHVIFIKAFTTLNGFIKNYTILGLLLLYAVGYFIYINSSLGDLLIPVIVYMLFILIMAWQGLSLYTLQKSKTHLLIAIAVVLFFISDSVLAIDKFKAALPFANLIIAATYWSAITLLALSTTVISETTQTKN